MNRVTIKQLAEYCRDYIDLVSPSIMSRGGKLIHLPTDVFSAEPLFINVAEINYDDQIVLPINIITQLSDLSIEIEEADNVSNKNVVHGLSIARELDDVYRKFETNSYTKQLSLQFGQISFRGIPNFREEDDEFEVSGHKHAEGYLFSVPIVLRYKDSAGQRSYEVIIDDTLIKTNIGFVKNYMKHEYRDELYRFVALEANEQNTGIPVRLEYVDELWSKITTYLRFSDAIDIVKTPDMKNVVIALEPKANYFLSQDLSGIIQAADDNILGETSLAAWVDKEEKYVTDTIDDTGEHELFFPFAYDKYQLQVLTKINNRGMIVEGPPGTGKSQTIANILVHLAAKGKKVLFVSQKDQAVRGVKDKLKGLNIPYLFGYMPDRSSRLHTEEDEKDSATYALRGISESHLDTVLEQDPKEILKRIASEVPSFNGSIDESRTFVHKYNEWSSLDEFDFGSKSMKITEDWYGSIQELRKNIETVQNLIKKLQKQKDIINHNIEHEKQFQDEIKKEIQNINQRFTEENDYLWLQNEREYIRGVGYEMLSNLTHETIASFETMVIDRKVNIISAKLNELKLSKELERTLRQLPLELFETYKTIIFSDNTKTERRILLEKIETYFLLKARLMADLTNATEKIKQLEKEKTTFLSDLSSAESRIGELNAQLNLKLLDEISMDRIERLYAIYKTSLFDKTHRRYELDTEIKSQICLNPNLVREEIMCEKQKYGSQVKNYIRNRIAARARTYRSQKQYRSALESIARKLSRTKKAYKTFDQLKSDPFNFEAMSAVTPIWMMGLDDASRILPLQPNLFDYVIVDEASQCNISYTLPVMYRAKHAIFFGDTLQMRDTTIAFKSNNQLISLARKHSIPEDLQIKAEGDSVKSVMDIAKLNGFEMTILKKHYRSPIELIGFSNENFYAPKNRRLEVVNDDIFVTEDGRILKTHLIQVDTSAEISSKSNLSEAYYIKQLINTMKSDERKKGKSIAVLSFFNEQTELLRRVIPDEDVKISTIEGIQGDERDIVIYSFVITSPNDKRRYIALTGESGEILKEINEGRVNVAFSRAKLQVHAVTSLAPNLWPDGIWIKRYLEYIEKHGRVKRLAKTEQCFDSHFEEEVYDYLMQKLDLNEYRISTQVESCGFKIDQVITSVKTGKKLAIECDGPTHFDDGDGQVRVESDFERQFVLETAHWTFYRISYIDWQQRKGSAKKDLLDAITDHFSSREESEIAEDTTHQGEKYDPKPIVIPESFINEQKEHTANNSARGYFGHPTTHKEPNGIILKKGQDEFITDFSDKNTLAAMHKKIKISDQNNHIDIGVKSLEKSRDKSSIAHLPEQSIGNVKKDNRKSVQSENVISNIKKAGIRFVDKRSNGGALWIVGGQELTGFVRECAAKGIIFKFKLGGGRATAGKDAWWIK